MQPETGLLESGMKEVLFKEVHEQVGAGRDHAGAHGSSLDLAVLLGVEEEVDVSDDQLGVWVRN